MSEKPSEILRSPALSGKAIGHLIEIHEELDSTNAYVLRKGAGAFPGGTVVLAKRQTAGRGRKGRAWFTLPGGLAFTIAYDEYVPIPFLNLITGLAISEGLDEICGTSSLVKWPNDVLINGLKVAGILSASAPEIDEHKLTAVGVGINVNTRNEDFPPDIADIATSTFTVTGREDDTLNVLVAILSAMNAYLEYWKRDEKALILKRRHERSYLLGHRIAVTASGRRSTGTAIAISPEGAIVAVDDNGNRREFVVGDVERLD